MYALIGLSFPDASKIRFLQPFSSSSSLNESKDPFGAVMIISALLGC